MWNAIIGLVATIAITVITYFFGSSLKGTKTEKIMKVAKGIIGAAVSSVEQLSSNTKMTSAEKKQLAIKNAEVALKQAGVNLPDSVVDMMVESEVYALKFFKKV